MHLSLVRNRMSLEEQALVDGALLEAAFAVAHTQNTVDGFDIWIESRLFRVGVDDLGVDESQCLEKM